MQIQQEMTVAFLQEFYQVRTAPPRSLAARCQRCAMLFPTVALLLPLQTVRDKCYKACVTKPSSSLSSSEQQCLARCCDRYADATQIVTKATLEMNGLE